MGERDAQDAVEEDRGRGQGLLPLQGRLASGQQTTISS